MRPAPTPATSPHARSPENADDVANSRLINIRAYRLGGTSASRYENSSRPVYGRLFKRELSAPRTGRPVEPVAPASSALAGTENPVKGSRSFSRSRSGCLYHRNGRVGGRGWTRSHGEPSP